MTQYKSFSSAPSSSASSSSMTYNASPNLRLEYLLRNIGLLVRLQHRLTKLHYSASVTAMV